MPRTGVVTLNGPVTRHLPGWLNFRQPLCEPPLFVCFASKEAGCCTGDKVAWTLKVFWTAAWSDKKRTGRAAFFDTTKPLAEGMNTALDGLPLESCPYLEGTRQRHLWTEGCRCADDINDLAKTNQVLSDPQKSSQ